MMRTILCFIAIIFNAINLFAGDFADGPIRYEVDFAKEHSQYKITKGDKRWVDSLLRNLNERSKATIFVRTDLSLVKDGVEIRGLIYQRVDEPRYCYVADGDVMLDLKNGSISSPGVGGFSMHSPKSRDFIVCLHFQSGGVPILRHSVINFSNTWWNSSDTTKRLEHGE